MQRRLKSLALLVTMMTGSFVLNAKQVKVLFIGNSYIYVNNLPQIIAGLATASGDQLIFNSSAPGGSTFQQHCNNPTTLALIAQGDWDYVVLQEQSQRPSFPESQVQQDVYPYARKLDSLVKAANPCTKTVFYMTWGRKNGDQANCPFFPPLCTYVGMDSMLQLRYSVMANDNGAVISPVAKVWRILRTNNPAIELYDADESHPSPAGSFAAACAFYSVLFQKDPSLNSYNSSLNPADAATIKNAAKLIAFDSLDTWYQHNPLPKAQFSYTVSGTQVDFQNTSTNATTFIWYFGDGDSSTLSSPNHTYATNSNYDVTLVAEDCGFTDTLVMTIQMTGNSVGSEVARQQTAVYPNPATTDISVSASAAIRTISILNSAGQTLRLYTQPNSKVAQLNIASLPEGIYLIELRTDDQIFRHRFVKH